MTASHPTALVLGASRTLGLALVAELLGRGWRTIGTVRGDERTALHELADHADGRLQVEVVDLTDREQLSALRQRLNGRELDLLFVNGAITRGNVPAADVPTETFAEVMITNALGPMLAIDALEDLVTPCGTIAVMSSRQGSVSSNTTGGQDVYRASKSALNQLMRCYAARTADDARTLLLVNPGHVQTDLGGPNAPLTVEQSIPPSKSDKAQASRRRSTTP